MDQCQITVETESHAAVTMLSPLLLPIQVKGKNKHKLKSAFSVIIST